MPPFSCGCQCAKASGAAVAKPHLQAVGVPDPPDCSAHCRPMGPLHPKIGVSVNETVAAAHDGRSELSPSQPVHPQPIRFRRRPVLPQVVDHHGLAVQVHEPALFASCMRPKPEHMPFVWEPGNVLSTASFQSGGSGMPMPRAPKKPSPLPYNSPCNNYATIRL